MSEQASVSTRERLLEAAGEVFGELGYRRATVRRICEAAGANVAAVNYHFESKEALYRTVLQRAFGAVGERPMHLPDGVPVAEQLRALVRGVLSRVFFAGDSWHGRVITQELSDPSGALEEVVDNFMGPMLKALDRLLTQVCPDLDQEARRLHCLSLISQCVFFRHARPILDLMFGPGAYTADTIPQLTDHIVTVFLRGLGMTQEGTVHGKTGTS